VNDGHVDGGRWRRADVAWRNVGPEVLIARPRRADFDVLQGAVAEVWRTLERPTSVTQVASILASRYDADPATIASDLAHTMADLHARGLVEEAAR
jgi:Coenzyme PQQ synthesis protein D (PqqD)